MSGHRKFSELTKSFSLEDKRRIAEMTAKMRAELRAQDDNHPVEETHSGLRDTIGSSSDPD